MIQSAQDPLGHGVSFHYRLILAGFLIHFAKAELEVDSADAILMTEHFIPNFCPIGLEAKLRRQ